MTDTPTPGSPAAVKAGCTCPTETTPFGIGYARIGCPVHSKRYQCDRCGRTRPAFMAAGTVCEAMPWRSVKAPYQICGGRFRRVDGVYGDGSTPALPRRTALAVIAEMDGEDV